ncbi:hypothetical protein KSP39_PZI009306 [Platanthera zijinensis]|uniref:SPARK domain-containing protein n=1 Tax=Platanthera zijinensis TaxID=2320716 RepID=A0AAP0BMM6_9ASPA
MSIIIAAALLLFLAPELATVASPPRLLSDISTTASIVPDSPVPGGTRNASAACELDLSAEMFGGVEEACGRGGNLDRSRCCPVLAAWLFAAHARSAFRLRPSASATPAAAAAEYSLPMMPDTDSKRCADALQTALAARNIRLPRSNATCDAALCFCGIHLHEIGSLSCSAAFNLSSSGEVGAVVKPTGAVGALERDCRNATFAGCSRCLNSLEKLKGGVGGGGGERVARMMDRDCRLMGLTWLLGRNKTAYIPTVSAVLRAILYSAVPPAPPYRCSSDRENMPLAVDTFQFERAAVRESSSVSRYTPGIGVYSVVALSAAVRVVM